MRPSEEGSAAVKALLAIIGTVLSLFLLSTVFFHWNLDGPGPLLVPRFSLWRFVVEIPQHWRWLVPFAVLTALVIPLRAIQWQRTLQHEVPFRERYHFVAIGAFTNNAIPGKLGDVFRAFLLGRTQGFPFVQSLGSILVCKLLELAALLLLVIASFLGPFSSTLARFGPELRIVMPICALLVALVMLLAHYAAPLAASLERRDRLPKLRRFLLEVGEGLGTARSFRGMAVALVYSVGPVLAPAIAYGLGLEGLGVRHGLFAGAVVLGAISLGQSVIGVPAGMGIYFFVTSWTARSLGASAEQAAAYATLTNFATVFTQLVVGAVSLRIRRIRWQELKRGTAEASEEMRHAAEEPALETP